MEISTITIPIYKFLDILTRHHEHANVDKEIADAVKAADPNENFCHVEYPGDREGDDAILIPRVWYIKDWKLSYERYVHSKSVADARRLKSNLRSEKIDELTALVRKKIPTLDDKLARGLATAIIDKNNLEAAKQFGIEEL